MLVVLTFLTTPTSDTRGTLLSLQANDHRYLIGNLHEGAQRAMVERSARSLGVSQVFLTGSTVWEKLGGMIGWILSTADAIKMASDQAREKFLEAKRLITTIPEQDYDTSVKKLASEEPTRQGLVFHGGPNLTHLLATGRRFIFRKGVPITIHEYDASPPVKREQIDPFWQNDQIRVWPMVLSRDNPSNTQQSEASESDLAKIDSLKSVVKDMFDSDWRKDDLAQMSLRDVKLPAAVFVRNAETRKIEQYRNAVPQQPSDRPDIQVLVRKPWPGALVTTLPSTQRRQTSMCYVIGLHAPRGKFLPQKAIKLNVPRGPAFSKLANGESVTARDGRTIRPEDVMEPPRSARSLLVAEIPHIDYIEPLVRRAEMQDMQILSEIVAAVWILGPGVSENARLQDFINQYPQWDHFISSPDHNADYLTFDGAAESTIRHHLIDPQRFEIPKYDNASRPLPPALSHCQVVLRGQRLRLEPDCKLEPDSMDSYLSTGNIVSTFPQKVQELAMLARKEIGAYLQQMQSRPILPGSDNEILTLGTGSALPSKHRNVSATLLRVPNTGSYLLDCGENTLGQLSRMYSSEELNTLLQSLKMIWISHMHADHHLGTISMLKAWHNAVHGGKETPASQPSYSNDANAEEFGELRKPGKLFIVSETAMIQYLKEYSTIEDIGLEHLILLEALPNSKESHTSGLRWNGKTVGFTGVPSELVSIMQTATGLSDLAVCAVPHCHGARGVALTYPDGFKLTYSGDARPSQNLVNIGYGSTVLLHEATFDDELQGEAKAKQHSTISEALGVGMAMKAQRVILTHFSQRYSRIPVMSDLTGKRIVLEETDASNQEASEALDDPDYIATLAVQNLVTDVEQGLLDTHDDLTVTQKPAHSIPTDLQQMTSMKVAVAFDSMCVKVKDIEVLEKLTPAFMELYKNANDHINMSDVERAEKQARAKERKTLLKEENKKKRLEQQKGAAPKRSKSNTAEELGDLLMRGDTQHT